MLTIGEAVRKLREYFSGKPEVLMAFVFGSYAKGTQCRESDIDVAVYFRTEGREIEWEETRHYDYEESIWDDVEEIVERNVGLLVMNRAPSIIVFEALRSSEPIIIKNRRVYLDLLSRASYEALDFMECVQDYCAIERRSSSLTETDRYRLRRHADFLRKELTEVSSFKDLDWKTYRNDAHKRRDVERWVENIVNCSLDIAKILLASEQQKIPDSYKGMLGALSLLPGFDQNTAEKLGEYVRLRNFLAHEYLDVRFDRIRKFIDDAESHYRALMNFLESILNT